MSARGSSVSPPGNSRRQRALNEPHEPFTRLAIMALVRVPPGDLKLSLCSLSPALNLTDSPRISGERVPLALIHCNIPIMG